MTVPVIELTDIHKVYGKGASMFHALKGVTFSIAEGEFVAIMGPSGSGKSTIMNILGCLDNPTSGVYSLGGVHLESLSRNQRALIRRHRLGFIFQGFNLLSRTSALENVELPLLYQRKSTANRIGPAMEALAMVGLTDWASHTPAELSGGQQQRVAIARAMVTRPAILLADEPTGNLDTKTSAEIMDLLTNVNRERNVTVIMVTHEEEMARYARRVIYFRDGVIEREMTREAYHVS